MKNLVVFILIIGVLALALYLVRGGRQSEQPTETQQLSMPAESTPAIPAQQLAVPPPQTATPDAEDDAATVPLPDLDQSDAVIQERLAEVHDAAQLEKLFLFADAVRRFVVTIDNMTTAKLPQKFKFTRLPEDKFLVQINTDGAEYINQDNYNRYTIYVTFIETLDMDKAVALYFKYYPIFQQAYTELGYPDRSFNDRLIDVVDHLLASPVVPEPVKLLRPKVYYIYADADLEALSAGQKLMIRIGQTNADRVKRWLQRLRVELAAGR